MCPTQETGMLIPSGWERGLLKGRGLEPQGKRGHRKGMPEISQSCKMSNCFMTLEGKGAPWCQKVLWPQEMRGTPKGFMAPHFWDKATKSGEGSGLLVFLIPRANLISCPVRVNVGRS